LNVEISIKMNAPDFWEDSARVEEFAGRLPDRSLLTLLEEYADPRRVRVLDLGCAGGRNATVLAERGFDLYAVDASAAMVEKTRERVAELLGPSEAQGRVRVGQMEDLSAFASGCFQLVVALGVYHNAGSQAQWDRAVAETARVLEAGGQVLVASFSPRSDPKGSGLRPIPGERHMYGGFDSGPLFLVEAEDLDAGMARHGLYPVVPSETVEVETDTGRRVTVNGLYRKR
jgi:SAM-dependent methyltransferase